MLLIRRLTAAPAPTVLAGLQRLLLDCVAGGASVGFLASLDAADAAQYWREVQHGLGPTMALWVAEQDGRVVGTVQLALCTKPNGQHRAEVQKLLVLSSARGRGIASQLLAAAEAAARQAQRTLLVLDTETGSVAEALYARRGWQKAGEIPNYARSPNGTLHATSYFYKLLEPA